MVEYVYPEVMSKYYYNSLYKKLYKASREPYNFEHISNADLTFRIGFFKRRNVHVTTNSEGLRETKEYGYLDHSIIFIGDSVVEGYTVSNDQTFENIFERLTGIPSLNFGIGTSNTKMEYYFLKAKYRNFYNAKHIILGFCLNDWSQTEYIFDDSIGSWNVNKKDIKLQKVQTGGIRETLAKSRFIILVWNWDTFRKIFGLKKAPKPFAAVKLEPEAIRKTQYYIIKMKEFADSIGAKFTVLIFPARSQFPYDYQPGERQQDLLIQILDKNKIDYLDPYNFLKEAYKMNRNIYWDEWHLDIKGHEIIGKFLAQNLKIKRKNRFKK